MHGISKHGSAISHKFGIPIKRTYLVYHEQISLGDIGLITQHE